MYRIGHGDCFLMAFPRKGGGDPVYVLIDCGQKPGSEDFIPTSGIGEIVGHLEESTNSKIDLAVITHEHQDHVNGVWKKTSPYFKNLIIEEAWFAWTEDPTDDLANRLRRTHKDQLLNLIQARHRIALAMGGDNRTVRLLDSLLSLEAGGQTGTYNLNAMLAAAGDPANSPIKQGMKYIKEKAIPRRGVKYLSPGGKVQNVEGTDGIRAFVLGPPRRESLLVDEEPVGHEAFPREHGFSFTSAVRSDPKDRTSPFGNQYALKPDEAFREEFFRAHYGTHSAQREAPATESISNASWRRIDNDWLMSAENLALKLNRGINNTSLVLAFELPVSKKILFFPGDAQRGGWISWSKCRWDGDDAGVRVKELLERTVLYKVSHHGSHNATLNAQQDADYPNLFWMAAGDSASEFTAMITAVEDWAKTVAWEHPLPSIKNAIVKKTEGRVFQTDIGAPVKPPETSESTWQAFQNRIVCNDLYFDLQILDA
jgi:beta-lactamase superfamily II metal-dependent hydrolase